VICDSTSLVADINAIKVTCNIEVGVFNETSYQNLELEHSSVSSVQKHKSIMAKTIKHKIRRHIITYC